MRILKQIFRLFKTKSKNSPLLEVNDSSTVNANPAAQAEIISHLSPIIRASTKIVTQIADEPIDNSQFESHFGGVPYFELGEEWPKSRTGRSMEFIFQIFNNGTINLPGKIKLVQLFYDMEEFPWQTEDDGWRVKVYESLTTENVCKHETPSDIVAGRYCKMLFEDCGSLPAWEGIELYDKIAWRLCALSDNSWETYDKAVTELIGEQGNRSQLGGYPQWVQGEGTPKKKDGTHMKLLFQIDSDENAELMWGDVGLIYVFYDEESKRIEFTLQCH